MSSGYFSASLTAVTMLNPILYTSIQTCVCTSPPHTQTLTQAGQAETEGDRDSKEMEIKIERQRQQRDKESCFTCASNSMAFIFFEGTKLNQKRKTKTGKEVREMKQIFKTKKREQELRMWLSW